MSIYDEQNYKIIQTTSAIYESDVSKWKVIYEPTDLQQSKKPIKTVEPKNEALNSSSRSSSDKSIADDTDTEEEIDLEIDEKKDKLAPGVCLLKFKK